MKKSEADQLQAKVKAKGGLLDAIGSTLGHEVRAKATKPKKVDLKQDNWIGSEDDFQIAVARLLDASGLDWFHVPNGGKRNAREGAKFKRMGVKSGVPDIIIVNPTKTGIYAGLCIELKVGKNRMSDSQREWERIFIQSRWHYYTAYGLSDVEILLSMHYGK